MTVSLFEKHPGFFDFDFVRQNSPKACGLSDDELLAQLLDRRNTQPFAPNPIFDCRYYAQSAAFAFAHDDANPIVHYLERGDFEGLPPNLFFCPTYYRRNNTDARTPGTNSVAHALMTGLSVLSAPHLLVDVNHISSQMPAMEMEAVVRDLFAGLLGRVDLHPLFCLECVERSVGRAFETVAEAFAAYLEHPGDVQTHPLLDPDFYADQLGENTVPRRALVHYLECHGAHDPHPLFDGAKYRSQVFDQWGTSVDIPLLHFATQIVQSQLSPSPFFDLPFYREVTGCGDDVFKHYLHEGGFRHYPPHPLIDLDDHHAAKAAGLALSEIPAVDVALRARRGVVLGINLVDTDFLEDQSGSDAPVTVTPIEAYFVDGLREGAAPSEMFSLPYMLRSVRSSGARSEGALKRYFESGLHKRPRVLFALPNLRATPENGNLLELMRVFSRMPSVETITLSELPGELEPDFRAYSHVQVLEEEPSPETIEQQPLEQRVGRFLRVLGANVPAIAICDQPERSELSKLLAASGIPIIPIVGKLSESALHDQLPGIIKSSSTVLFHSPAGFENARLEGVMALPQERNVFVQFVKRQPDCLPNKAGARWRIGVPETAKLVLGGGDLTLDSGLEEFVSIARRCLQQDDHANDLYFVWAGEGPTHPHSLHFYVSLHNRLRGFDQRILIAPSDVETHVLCDAADVVLQPVSGDPAVSLLLEATASGCPMVISSAAGGFDELYDAEVCLSYRHCDLDGACKALHSLLQDPELYDRYSSAAAWKIRARWSFDVLVNRFIDEVGRHASTPVRLPLYQAAVPREWDVYMRGRASELEALQVLHGQIGLDDWKLICLCGEQELGVDEVITASTAGDHAVYQIARAENGAIEDGLKTAVLDHSAPKSVFVNLHDVLSEQILQCCQSRRVLLLSGQVDVTGRLYDLGLLFDEIFVSDADTIDQMHDLNPLIASRMVMLPAGGHVERPIRSTAGQV